MYTVNDWQQFTRINTARAQVVYVQPTTSAPILAPILQSPQRNDWVQDLGYPSQQLPNQTGTGRAQDLSTR